MLLTLHALNKDPKQAPISILIEWGPGMWMRRLEENQLTFIATVNEKGIYVTETPEEIQALIKKEKE
jgi:hypothetical protein